MMYCVRHIAAAVVPILIQAQASQMTANSSGPSWLRGVFKSGPVECSVQGECVVGSGLGGCFVSVDPFAVQAPLSSTDLGNDVEFIDTSTGVTQTGHSKYTYPPASPEMAISAIAIVGQSPAAHWNLCWTAGGGVPTFAGTMQPAPSLRGTGVEDYCYYVNGLCWLWASPCSGGCSQLNALSTYNWFCPAGLRYATQSEFDAAAPTLNANKATFWSRCAASQLDPTWNHCDDSNPFVRVEDNSYLELVLVCGGSATPPGLPTPSPTFPASAPMASAAGGAATASAPGEISATGDPHLQNVYGERFDLMRAGKHVLVQIPRGQPTDNTVLRVEADAVQLGAQCVDMYFQELNITGAWVQGTKQDGGLRFRAQDVVDGSMKWEQFGKVELKVVHGRTKQGTQYLNLYAKRLDRTGLAVGGLLGEDDHSEAALPPRGCAQTLSLIQGKLPFTRQRQASSVEAVSA